MNSDSIPKRRRVAKACTRCRNLKVKVSNKGEILPDAAEGEDQDHSAHVFNSAMERRQYVPVVIITAMNVPGVIRLLGPLPALYLPQTRQMMTAMSNSLPFVRQYICTMSCCRLSKKGLQLGNQWMLLVWAFVEIKSS